MGVWDLIGPLFVGLAGSFHCVGMCGPIVLAYSLQEKAYGPLRSLATKGVRSHLLFHCGRVSSYAFVGCLAWTIGHGVELKGLLGHLRGWGSLAAGAVMIAMGLVLAGFVPSLSGGTVSPSESKWSPGFWVKRWIGSSKPMGKVALGVATGFLPCMLPWAMIVKAAVSDSFLEALSTMVLFGVGTVPILLLLGLCATAVSVKVRLVGEKVAALGVMAMGAMVAYKGLKAISRLHGS